MKKTKDPIVVPAMLRVIQEGIHATGDILDVFLSGYGESYRKLKRLPYGDREARMGEDWGDRYIESQRVYNLLSYLKEQGFIEKDESKGRKRVRWALTKKGRARIKKEDLKKETYESKKDTVFRVVIYDIPEAMKVERNWLRGVLRSLGFTLLQGSVWAGKRKVPERFFFELKERRLLPYLHIFEVEREGSIVREDLEGDDAG